MLGERVFDMIARLPCGGAEQASCNNARVADSLEKTGMLYHRCNYYSVARAGSVIDCVCDEAETGQGLVVEEVLGRSES